jgi:hypothetical protein
MKLKEFRERSDKYTEKSSEITRQLSLAGIAIIWLFKNADDKQILANIIKPILDPYLKFPLVFLVLALFFDLAQYILGGTIWIKFFRGKEKELKNETSDPDIKAPTNLRKPIYFSYWAKIICML